MVLEEEHEVSISHVLSRLSLPLWCVHCPAAVVSISSGCNDVLLPVFTVGLMYVFTLCLC